MTKETNQLYRFGGFQLNATERVLLRDGEPIPLVPKALETLLVLVANHGHLVEKEELLKRIWPDTFVEEGAVAQSIFTLRRTLGDSPDGHAYIETVPRRGYRFVAAVQEGTAESAPQTVPQPVSTMPRPRTRRVALALACVGGVLGLLFLTYLVRGPFQGHKASPGGKIMLAVLPFENLTGDPQQEYFSDGFTEEIITHLGRLNPGRLGVIARTSAMQYKNTNKRTDQIGRELGVDYVLEGSVRHEGNRVRISAQLIQVRDQTHLWAESYERDLHDVLALENDVANAIAGQIQLKLTPQQQFRLASTTPVDPEAYQLYLKGRYFWNKRTEAAYVKAIEYFNQAIARAPEYAQAYSGLADAYALLGSWPNAEVPRKEAMPRAKAAALTALKLDGSMAEAHTSLAFVEMHYEWNWQASEQEFKRALELNPNYATAHQWFAVWLMAQRRTDEALEEISRAQRADPLSLIIRTDGAELLMLGRRFDQAIQKARETLELDPDFRLAHYVLAEAYGEKGMYSESIFECQRALVIDNNDEWCHTVLGRTYALLGQRANAEKILAELLTAFHRRSDLAIEIAQLYTALGEKNQAFAWLEKAYQNREGALILLNVTPIFDRLHSDPRFADLLRRVGVPP